MSPKATKEQILLATIDAIEKHGIQNLTTRVIADEAGVNNAALHYYYGTKDQLLEAALSTTIVHWVEDTSEMLAADAPVQERLRAVLDYLVDGVIRYPNLIRAHIQGPIMEGNPDSAFVRMLSTWLDEAYTGLEADVTPEQRKVIRIAMQTVVSSILVTSLMPDATGFASAENLRDDTFRAEYIDYLLNSILNVSAR
jgi:TetR/AcrR family transcriptional regulator, regulator of cefoperazone and chloramphenicol sensitivity